MTGEVQPQDKDSGLVERSWVRTHRKGGQLTERTREGQEVEATFQNRHGHVQHAAGTVRRSDAGELVVESWADGVRTQTPVTRDANVDVIGRK
jgi:uncharacterized protein YycO